VTKPAPRPEPDPLPVTKPPPNPPVTRPRQPTTPEVKPPVKPPPPATNFRHYPPLWEGRHRDGVMWTNYLTQLIANTLAAKLLPGSRDVKNFCPKYQSLNTDQRVNFWIYLVSAVVKFESGFDPTNRSREHGMGTDPITGQQVHSEGLLQLSYQDIQGRKQHCEFDWGRDKHLPPRSPQKTILDPLKNLKCGINILANQIQNQGLIATTRRVYWSVLNPEGQYSKVPQIQALTKKIPFCVN
jgi:hypothetical protein